MSINSGYKWWGSEAKGYQYKRRMLQRQYAGLFQDFSGQGPLQDQKKAVEHRETSIEEISDHVPSPAIRFGRRWAMIVDNTFCQVTNLRQVARGCGRARRARCCCYCSVLRCPRAAVAVPAAATWKGTHIRSFPPCNPVKTWRSTPAVQALPKGKGTTATGACWLGSRRGASGSRSVLRSAPDRRTCVRAGRQTRRAAGRRRRGVAR
jgi:hypothetical protein